MDLEQKLRQSLEEWRRASSQEGRFSQEHPEMVRCKICENQVLEHESWPCTYIGKICDSLKCKNEAAKRQNKLTVAKDMSPRLYRNGKEVKRIG